MKKLLYKVTTDSNDIPEIEYSLIKGSLSGTNVYGVEICTGEGSACINDIFTDYEYCINFISLLAAHTISPIHLRDIAEDFLSTENPVLY